MLMLQKKKKTLDKTQCYVLIILEERISLDDNVVNRKITSKENLCSVHSLLKKRKYINTR